MDLGAYCAPGDVFAGDFRIERLLAEGGMGRVYVARQLSTRKLRALKVLRPALLVDPAHRERFLREAFVTSEVKSDHVVDVIAAGVDERSGAAWLAMELLEGSDLGAMVRARGSLGAYELLGLYGQLCHALGAAHAAGVVHRDLKPANVFVAASRRPDVPFTVKLLDFGIAKLVMDASGARALPAPASPDGAPTAQQALTAALGSPTWMAPEQIRMAGVGPQTDVWALGLLAFYVLVGKAYWVSANVDVPSTEAVLAECLFAPIDDASARAAALGRPGVLPEGFDAWFARCVCRNPRDRYPDARAAFEALSAALERAALPSSRAASDAPGPRAASSRPPARVSPRVHKAARWVVPVLAGVLAWGGAWQWMRSRRMHGALAGAEGSASGANERAPRVAPGSLGAGDDPETLAAELRAVEELERRLRWPGEHPQQFWLASTPLPTQRRALVEAGFQCLPLMQDGVAEPSSAAAAERLEAITTRLALLPPDPASAPVLEQFRARVARYRAAYDRLAAVSAACALGALAALLGLGYALFVAARNRLRERAWRRVAAPERVGG